MAILSVMITTTLILIDVPGQLNKSKDARRKSDLSLIQKALDQYYQDKGQYPFHDVATFEINDGTYTYAWGSAWNPYTPQLPKDPASPTRKYVYFSPNRQEYYLYASLERGGLDSYACFTNGNSCASTVAYNVATKCGGNCNYGVTSPNTTP